jgi:hypothetical protein
MAKEKFIDHKFNAESTQLITKINDILREYAAQGYRLSLRQLYYQLVARALVENSIKSYKRIGNIVSDARLAGMIDWRMIEDRGRETNYLNHWEDPAEIIRDASRWFRVDHWAGQRNHVEVMVEKDALSGILLPVCQQLDIRFTANKGYSSSSAMYEMGKRLAGIVHSGDIDEIHIFYFGDHDPSGIDMTRDIAERLSTFTYGAVDHLNVHRLALNWDQIDEWQPPENPAKESDSRYQAYADQFGESSWELDAVEPRTLAELVRENVRELIDEVQWDVINLREEEMRDELKGFANAYEEKQEIARYEQQRAEEDATKEAKKKAKKKGKRK